MFGLSIKTDNISYQHHYDLACKMRMSMHPKFNDIKAQKLVREEIEKRRKNGKWKTKYDEFININYNNNKDKDISNEDKDISNEDKDISTEDKDKDNCKLL